MSEISFGDSSVKRWGVELTLQLAHPVMKQSASVQLDKMENKKATNLDCELRNRRKHHCQVRSLSDLGERARYELAGVCSKQLS